jgi:hypothetical protein
MCGSGQSKQRLSEKKQKSLWLKDEHCALELTLTKIHRQVDPRLFKNYEVKQTFPSFALLED